VLAQHPSFSCPKTISKGGAKTKTKILSVQNRHPFASLFSSAEQQKREGVHNITKELDPLSSHPLQE
jgi:hypothetical protein